MNRDASMILTVLLILSLALTAGCGGGGGGSAASGPAAVTPGPGLATIRGYVTDPSSGQPVAGAIVELSDGTGLYGDAQAAPPRGSTVRRAFGRTPVATTVTDAKGYYEFARVPAGDYGVTVSKDGKTGAFMAVRAGSDVFVDGTIQLTPVVTVSGSVTLPRLPGGNDKLPPIVWFSGTSFGTICQPVSTTGDPLVFSYAISGVPVKAGQSYTVAVYAADAVSQTHTLVFTHLGEAILDGVVKTIPENTFALALGTFALTADLLPVNQLPVANAGSDQVVVVGSPVTLDGTASSDPDAASGETLTYNWIQTAGFRVSLTSTAPGVMTFTPTRADSYVFMLIVRDAAGAASDPAIVTVEVTAPSPTVNQPPLADAGPNQTVAANAVVTLSGAASSDPDAGTTLTYRWIQIAGPTVTLATPTAVTTTFTPTTAQEYTFALTVSDGLLSSSPAFVRVTVTGTGNQPPLADAGTDQAIALTPGSPVNVTLSATASDPDGTTAFTWNWSQVSGPPVTLSALTIPSPTFTTSLAGPYVFSLVVGDGQSQSVPDYVQILVQDPANLPPVADAGPDQPGIAAGSVITLSGATASDPESGSLTYAWTQTAGPPVTIADPAVLNPQVTVGIPGIVYLSLVASDGVNQTPPDYVRIQVVSTATPNNLPQADAGADQTVLVNSLVTLSGSATDADPADTLRYLWRQIGGPAATLSSTTVAAPTFTPTVAGYYEFMLVASDGQADSLPDFVYIRVDTPANQTPTAVAGADQSGVLAGAAVTLDGSASTDPDAGPQALTYRWNQLLGPVVTIATANAAVASVIPADAGVYEFELTVSDGAATATDRVQVIVNRRPVADAGTDQNDVLLNSLVTLSGAASFDPDGAAITAWNWSVVSEPAGSAVTLVNPATAAPEFTATHIGRYVLRLVVSDGLQVSAPAEVRVLVTAPSPNPASLQVTMSLPGSADTLAGLAGAVPGLTTVVASTVPFQPQPANILGSAVAAADGSFGAFSIGDNDPRIVSDSIYVMVADPGNQVGPAVRLVNDVTPPQRLELTPADPPPPVNDTNVASYLLTGLTEPGADVELVLTLDPVNRVSQALTADANGAFSAALDLSALPDASGYTLFARATDTVGNVGNFVNLGGGILKDTVPPVLSGVTPVGGSFSKPDMRIGYTLSRDAGSLDITILRTGGAADANSPHSGTLTSNAFISKGDHFFNIGPFLANPLVDGAIYSLTLQATGASGSAGAAVTVTNLTVDAQPVSGVTVSAPLASGTVFADRVFVGYDLSLASEAVVGIRVTLVSAGDERMPVSATISDAGQLTIANHPTVPLPLGLVLRQGVNYAFGFEFFDAAGNAATASVTGVTAKPNTAAILVDRPRQDQAMKGVNPFAAYTLSEGLASATISYRRVSGTGTLSYDHSLAAGDRTGGYHLIPVPVPGLVDGDIYNVSFFGLTTSGLNVGPVTVTNILVDAVPPTVTTAIALQRVANVWSPGDQVILNFSERMDDTPLSGPLNGFLAKQEGAGAGFTGYDSIVWSDVPDSLTITFTAANLPDFSVAAAKFQTTARDRAGNPIAFGAFNTVDPATYFMFTTSGDVTPPPLHVVTPLPGAMITPSPSVTFELGEDLVGGEIKIVGRSGVDALSVRIAALTGAELLKTPVGSPRVIDLGVKGITLLPGNRYDLFLSGRDGGGNSSEVTVTDLGVSSPAVIPAPDPASLYFRNYSGVLMTNAALVAPNVPAPDGTRICVQFGAGATYEAAFPLPYFAEQVVISGIPTQAGDIPVYYSWKAPDGTFSTFSQDGTVPTVFKNVEIGGGPAASFPGYGILPGTTDFQLDCYYAVEHGGSALAVEVYTNFNMDGTLYYSGYNQFQTFNPLANAIPLSAVQAGHSVYYVNRYATTTGHFSDYAGPDGVIPGLIGVNGANGGVAGVFDNNDQLILTISGDTVKVHSLITPVSSGIVFACGSTTVSLGTPYYTSNYPADMLDFNISAWSNSSSGQEVTYPLGSQWPVQGPASTVTVTLTTFTVTGAADRVSFGLKANGSQWMRSNVGWHCVVPEVDPITGPNSGGITVLESEF